jgi:hypothetical protein
MKTLAAILTLGALAGMLISWPMYFFELKVFATRLQSHHPEAWARYALVPTNVPASQLQLAYKALRDVRAGKIAGEPLHAEVRNAHAMAIRLLYAGLTCFLLFLLVSLVASLGWTS